MMNIGHLKAHFSYQFYLFVLNKLMLYMKNYIKRIGILIFSLFSIHLFQETSNKYKQYKLEVLLHAGVPH
jgi:hypothetical protein